MFFSIPSLFKKIFILICKDIAARTSTTESCFAPSLSPAAICIFLFLNQSCSMKNSRSTCQRLPHLLVAAFFFFVILAAVGVFRLGAQCIVLQAQAVGHMLPVLTAEA